MSTDWVMDLTMQAMSYWLKTSYVGNSGGYFLFRMCFGYCADLLEFMSVWINKLTLWPVDLCTFTWPSFLLHVHFRLHCSCGLCHGLTGRVGNGVLQVDVYRPCCVRFLSPSSSRWSTFFQCCFTNRELNGSNHFPDSNIALFLDSFDVKGCANNSFKTSASVLKPCVKLCSKRS